jgi:cholesterol oxidase
MHWLSQSAESLIQDCETGSGSKKVDVAVVGSGYGGAVAALRFAEHGHSVLVLERGQEYVAGEFPNDLSQVGKHVRSEIAATTGVTSQGYEDALFDFRLGYKAGALVGNGLGGGSLINAGVGLQPDAKVFEQEEWPAALRQEDLQPYFNRAKYMLELQIPGQPTAGCEQSSKPAQSAKFQRLQALGEQTAQRLDKGDRNLQIQFEAAPIAVQLDSAVREDLGQRKACIGCGDCVTGCNYQAKLSLTATYLPRAVKAGAKLHTGLSVLCVSYDDKDPAHPWVLHFVRTGERKLQHELEKNRQACDPSPRDGWIYTLRARRVVLAAGTFGSTEILLRSRKRGLSLSNTALGVGISGNGDDVAFGYDLKQPANAVGWGSKPVPQTPVGPTISGVIRYTDPFDVRRGTLLQDGAVPGLMRGVFHELATTLGAVAQLGNWRYRALGEDPLALQPKALQHSMSLLGMGHDSAGGVIAYDHASDRVQWGWPKAEQEAGPALHRQRSQPGIKALGGIYIQNPAVSLLPDALGSVLSGPKPGGTVFTVHPLGGCRMGDSPLTGVVNHWGQAFHADGHLHDGLYVLDGSTLPSALGANPMLTITALAERACEKILLGMYKPASNPNACPLPAYPSTAAPLKVAAEAQSSVMLAEVLRGQVTLAPMPANAPARWQALNSGQSQLAAALFLEFEVPHWQALWKDRWHHVHVKAGSRQTAHRYTSSRLVLDGLNSEGQHISTELQVLSGTVDLFCQGQEHWTSGWYRQPKRWLRTGLTYWLGRWGPDIFKPKKKTPDPGFWQGCLQLWGGVALAGKIWDGMKLIGHASEVREFHYKLQLADELGHHYTLQGKKTIAAAASWQSLWRWRNTASLPFFWPLKKAAYWPAPQRPSLWQQLTQLDMHLSADLGGKTRPLAHGRLAMDLPDMLRNVQPQLGQNRDSLTALLDLAGYPLLMLRALLKTRLLDLRLPDYKTDGEANSLLPFTDPALIDKPPNYCEFEAAKFPALKSVTGACIQPELHPLTVPLTWPSTSGAAPELIGIGLVRYRQAQLVHSAAGGVHRVKSIVLINGFLLTGHLFVAEGIYANGGDNLATQLHKNGWDVWLLEYRASPLLDASAKRATMDDVAAFDIPAAVQHITRKVSVELQVPEAQTQIFAYSRCVGSASLSMSLLSGYLRHAAPDDAAANQAPVNQLAGVLLSDFQPFVIGSVSAQMRLQLSAFLSNVLKIDALEFTAGTVQSNLLYTAIDRLLSSAHYAYAGEPAGGNAYAPHGERCPHESDLRKPQPDSTTCKRISGLMSRSYSHAQLSNEAHARLDEFFGRGNLGVFSQGAKCLEYERLVNADGQNVYLTDQAILQYLNMPLMLLHGQLNVLFDKESLAASGQQLDRIFGRSVPRLLVPAYAHVDLLLGKNAPTEVFPQITAFFDTAYSAPSAPAMSVTRCRARTPRTGPIVGWVRPAGPDKPGRSLLRIWIEVDNSFGDLPVAALSVLECGSVLNPQRKVQTWPIRLQALQTLASAQAALPAGVELHASVGPLVQPLAAQLHYAVADIEVAADDWDPAGQVRLQMLSIHCYAGPSLPAPALPKNGSRSDLPTAWGAPLTLAEVLAAAEPPPAQSVVGYAVHTTNAVQAVAPHYADLPLQDGQTIAPLAVALDPLAADLLLGPLDKEIELCRERTRRADPQTLSRLRRRAPLPLQRQLTLAKPQLQNDVDGNLSFFAAACRHPGLTGFEIERADASLLVASQAIDQAKPRFMLMLGDQIYADARGDLMGTESPIERLLPHYRDAFGTSRGFRKLAQRLPLYMVMDDHEIGDNWSKEHARASSQSQVLASNAQAAFNVFQYAHGPGAPSHPTRPGQAVEGFNTSYEHSGVPFIVLDTRTQRTRVPQRRILHESQWAWLEHWLVEEQKKGGHPKFVVSGSVFAPGLQENAGYHAPRGADSWQLSPAERRRLLCFIVRHNIDNVVFLSSDYHCAAAAKISFKHSKLKAWAIAAPPLHAPLRFANAPRSSVLPLEQIYIHGDVAELHSQAWDGEGWLECKVQRQSACITTLQLRFNLRGLEQATWTQPATQRVWVLQTQGAQPSCDKPLSGPQTSAADSTRPCPAACCAAPAQPAAQAQC